MSRARVLGAVTALVCLAGAGCSSSSYSTSSDATSTRSAAGPSGNDLCGSADALRSSMDDLREVQVAKDGTPALQKAFSEVGDDVNRLAGQAKDEFSDQVSGVTTAVGDVAASVDTLASAPSAAAASAVGTAVGALAREVDVLLEDVGSSC